MQVGQDDVGGVHSNARPKIVETGRIHVGCDRHADPASHRGISLKAPGWAFEIFDVEFLEPLGVSDFAVNVPAFSRALSRHVGPFVFELMLAKALSLGSAR